MSNTRSRMCELKGLCVFNRNKRGWMYEQIQVMYRKGRNTKELLTYMRATVCMQLIVNGTAILSQTGLALMMSAACLRLIRHIKGATVPEGARRREIWICLHAYTSSFVSITAPCLWASWKTVAWHLLLLKFMLHI